MRGVFLFLVLVGVSAFAGAKKPPKPPPPPPPEVSAPSPAPVEQCLELAACLAKVEAAFEAGDFELAQRRVRLAEPLSTTASEQARVLILQGALDAQALGLSTPALSDAVRAKFKEARRLDERATFLLIPAFARTDALETLWNEAAPPAPIVVPDAPVKKKAFPLVPTLLGSGAVVALGVSLGLYVSAVDMNTPRTTDMDDVTFSRHQTALSLNTASQVAWAVGAALAAGALVTFLFWLADE